jgi:hypothetical protein
MIERTVEELRPIIGTRPACRAVGASVATMTPKHGHLVAADAATAASGLTRARAAVPTRLPGWRRSGSTGSLPSESDGGRRRRPASGYTRRAGREPSGAT